MICAALKVFYQIIPGSQVGPAHTGERSDHLRRSLNGPPTDAGQDRAHRRKTETGRETNAQTDPKIQDPTIPGSINAIFVIFIWNILLDFLGPRSYRNFNSSPFQL